MSWVTELYDLYDRNAEQAGIITENNPVLLPVYHTTVTAQIEVTLDYQGNFLKAVRIPEVEKSTVIPITDKSSSRTNTPAPNPLCDNLKYLAGDYTLGKLNKDGQRISIRIEIPRKGNGKMVSFLSGWMVYSNGLLRLTTPYGGK